jgi:hypothetical protein
MMNLRKNLIVGAVAMALTRMMPMGGQSELIEKRGHGKVFEETIRQKEKKKQGKPSFDQKLDQMKKRKNRRYVYVKKRKNRRYVYEWCIAEPSAF